MCPRLLCRHSAGQFGRGVLFYTAAWLGWFLSGLELGLMLNTDEPFLAFLDITGDRQPPLLAALLAAHAAAAGLGGLAAGRWADSLVETRALVIMAAVPQLLGAILYFFAGTLAELILARMLTGLGTGAAVAMLCELLRVAPAKLRCTVLAGLAISRELGVGIGPTISAQLDSFPELPADVLRHRVTPWNAAGLLLLICHFVYLLLLILLYPNLTLELEAEMLDLRRHLFPYADVEPGGDPFDENYGYNFVFRRYASEAAIEIHSINDQLQRRQRNFVQGQLCVEPELPVAIPRPPTTPSPSPPPPRTASQLAAIGQAFANPGTPEPLLPPPRQTPQAPRQPPPPPPPQPPPPAGPEKGPRSAEAAPDKPEDVDSPPAGSSVEAELDFPQSSRSQTSDEDKNPLQELRARKPGTAEPKESRAPSGERADSGLRARRWPKSPDLTIAAPSSPPRTPAEKTGWFTPDETPGAARTTKRGPHAAGSVQEVPPAAALLQGDAAAAESVQRAPSGPEPPQGAATAAEPPREESSTTGPLQDTTTIPESSSLGAQPSAKPDQESTSSGGPSQERPAAARIPKKVLPSPGRLQAALEASGVVTRRTTPTPDLAPDQQTDRSRSGTPQQPNEEPQRHLDQPGGGPQRHLDQPGEGPQRNLDQPNEEPQRHLDQPDRATPPDRPLEGPYAEPLEGPPDVLIDRLREWFGRPAPGPAGQVRNPAAIQRTMRRVFREWEHVLCGPTVALLVCCLVTFLAQSAVDSLLPFESGLGPLDLSRRWMMGTTAATRLGISVVLLATYCCEQWLGAVVVGFSLVIQVLAHLHLALSLSEVHDYTFDFTSPEPPPDDVFAWAWVLRIALCLQSAGKALFETVALLLFSQMVPRTLMGRGVSFWMLTVRAGVLLGPFWTVGLVGNPLPQFLVPMVALIGCISALIIIRYCYLFSMRTMHVVVLDRIGPRLPVVGLRGRTLTVINHLRQFYCAEAADAVADAEGGAAVAPGDVAAVAPGDGDRRPLLEAEAGR